MRRFAGVASVLFTCAVGCGSDEHFGDAGVAVDGERADASVEPDGGPPDAGPPTTVTVTTYARCDTTGTCADAPDALAAGVAVIVTAPDGSAGDSGVTDAAGELVLEDVVPGSAVTAIYEFGAHHRLTTTVGVEPGDHLVYGDHYYTAPAGGVAGTVTVTFPVVAGATRYQAYHPCGVADLVDGAATSIALAVSADCQTATADIALVARDNQYDIIASGLLDDAAYTGGATPALATWTTVVPDSYTVTIADYPADAPFSYAEAHAQVGDRDVPAFSFGTFPFPEGGNATFSTSLPANTRTWSANELLFSSEVGDQVTYRAGAANATAATLTTPDLPRVGAITVNPSLQVVGWVQGAGTYDVAYARLQWDAQEGFFEEGWDILIPPGVTSFHWDTVPAALAPYLPQTNDSITTDVRLVDLGSATSYDELRAIPTWQLACAACAMREGDQTAIDVALQGDGAEGPVGSFRPATVRPAGGHSTTSIDLSRRP